MCTPVRGANCSWAGNAKRGWEEGNVGSYTGGPGFKIIWKGSIVFQLWCKAAWLKAQLGILVRGHAVQGQRSRCPILGGLLLLPGSPAQADGQVDWPWLSLSPWPALAVPKITRGKSLWCAGDDVAPGCSTRDGRCLCSACHLLAVVPI